MSLFSGSCQCQPTFPNDKSLLNIEHMIDIDIDLSPVLLDVVGSLSDVSVQGDVRKVLRKTQIRTKK